MIWYFLGNTHTALLWGNCAAACQPSLWLLHLRTSEMSPRISHSAFLCLVHWSGLSSLSLQLNFSAPNKNSLQLFSCSPLDKKIKYIFFSLYNIKAVKDLKIWYSISILVCHRKETGYALRCTLLNLYTEFYQEKKILFPLLSSSLQVYSIMKKLTPPTANMQQVEKTQHCPPVPNLLKTVTCKCNSLITHLTWIYHLYLSTSSLCREKFSIQECKLILRASFHSASMLHVLLPLLRLPLPSAPHYLLPANTLLTKSSFSPTADLCFW